MASSNGDFPDTGHPSAVDDSPGSGSHGHGADGYVDFDEYIDIQLRKAGSTIKSTDVMTAVVGAGTLLTAYLLIFIMLDQWVVPGGFSPTSRLLLLSALLVGVAGWIGWKVLWPWRRRVNGLYSASTIEKASPGFKGSLVNLVDLLRAEREIPPEIYKSLERRAAVALTHVDVRESVDRHLLLRLSMALFAVVVLFCGYWIFSPKNPASSLWRAIAPASDATVATRTKIDLVRPGDVDVVARSQVDVTAEVRGQMPPQAALYYTTADHKFVDERIDARATAEASREFHFVINGDNGAGILQDMTYRIVAGDDSSRDYKIHVIQPPAATIDSIRLDYPEYTRLGTSTQTTGAIDALEGTRVTLRATANMPLRSASVQFFDDESASKRAEEVPVHIESGNKLVAEWPLQMRSDGTYAHFYRIFCTSVGGESERAPSLYSVAISADRHPEIVLLDPKADLELPANAELPLLFDARDPDFALTYINLKIEKDGASVIGPEIYDGHDHPDQHLKRTYKWSLKEYHFRPKETITYWLEAADNCKPVANTTGTSPRLRIRITDPVPESQVKKNFDLAEKRQQEEAKHSDDEKNAQPKQEEDQLADATKPGQERSKPQPKEGQQNASSAKEEKPPEQQPADQQNPDQQNKTGDKGSGGDGDSKGSGGGDKGDKGNAENGQGGQNGQSQKPNPDDPSSDPKALQTMHDHFQKEGDKGGNGSESKSQDGDKDSKGKNGDDKSGEQKREQKGSQPPQDGKSPNDKRENQPGQPGNKPQPGSQSNPQSNSPDGQNQPNEKNKDGQNQDGKKPDGKEGQNPDQSANRSGAGSNRDLNQERQPQSQIPAGGDKNPPGEKSKPDKQAGAQPSGEQQAPDKQPADKEAGPKQPGEKQPGDKTGQKPEGQNSEAGKKPEPGQKSEAGQQSNQSQEQGQQTKPGDKSQTASKEARDGKEKGQPSPGDQSSADNKNQNTGRSSDSNSQPDQSQAKPDASQNRSKGAKPSDQNDNRSPSGNPQRDASQRDKAQDPNDSKSSKPADEQPGGKTESAAKNEDRKDATKNADPTGRSGERTPQPQREAGAKPHPGQPQDSPQNFDRKETPPGEKPDAKDAKRRPNNQDPEEHAKAVDKNTDKSHAKSMRDEKQSNSKGDEQSDVGKTGDTKRTLDKNAPLSQKGTENEGAKQKTTEQGPPPKDGQEKPSQKDQKDQSGQERPGQEGGPPKPGQESSQGKPKEGQPGEKGQPGQNGKETQSAQPGQDAKQGKEGQQGQPGDGKPGQQPGQGRKSGDQGGGDKPSKPGQSTASGMGNGNGTNNGGGGHNNGTGNGQGEGLVNTEKEANLNYARKATDLILNRLQGQLSRGKVDESLLKELGWTKDEVRRFVERMRRQAQSEQGGNTPADEARRLQWEETLRSLELKQSPRSRSGAGVKKIGGLEMENRRSAPPPEFRELYEAYTKSVNSQTPRDKK
jgi:collagen type III alpha